MQATNLLSLYLRHAKLEDEALQQGNSVDVRQAESQDSGHMRGVCHQRMQPGNTWAPTRYQYSTPVLHAGPEHQAGSAPACCIPWGFTRCSGSEMAPTDSRTARTASAMLR